MVVDTSALLAILFQEREAAEFSELIFQALEVRISTASVLEASIVLEGRYEPTRLDLDGAIEELELTIVQFDESILPLARLAFRQYGKGRHPAALNFGDCISYATAKRFQEPLLYKGEDFARTDIIPASRHTSGRE
ncbi:MAG: type II toxin-antitoxin system VapC family toxin [Bryobacteraceae bacterium]